MRKTPGKHTLTQAVRQSSLSWRGSECHPFLSSSTVHTRRSRRPPRRLHLYLSQGIWGLTRTASPSPYGCLNGRDCIRLSLLAPALSVKFAHPINASLCPGVKRRAVETFPRDQARCLSGTLLPPSAESGAGSVFSWSNRDS